MVTLLGFLLAHLGLVVCFSSVVEDLKKDYAVIVYYLGLYEEGEVEHTNNFTHPFPLIFHTCSLSKAKGVIMRQHLSELFLCAYAYAILPTWSIASKLTFWIL